MDVQVKSWKTRRKEQLREEIISSARDLFTANGLDATSVDEIVAKTGIAKGTFYLYFKTKAEIAQIIIDETISDFEKSLQDAAKCNSDDACDELKSLINAHINFFSNRSIIHLFPTNNTSISNTGLLTELLHKYTAVCIKMYDKTLRKGMLQGIFREVDARLFAGMIKGMVEEILRENADFKLNAEELLSSCIGLIENGIKR